MKIKNKSFLLVVIGQIISLFGNGILRFALPLHLLKLTGSAAIFGMVSALSFLPLVLIMPIGGIITDRLNKRNIMVFLDTITAVLMLLFIILYDQVDIITLVIVTMMVLYGISGLYQPTVSASVPIILEKTFIMQGNSIISMVAALSNLTSPIIGGVLYGIYGVTPIIITSIVCFFSSAILEIFIKIPHKKSSDNLNIISIVKSDISISTNFIFKKKKILYKIILATSALNAFVSSLLMISMPVIITERLFLSEELYGVASAVLGIGALVGGIVSSQLKTTIDKSYKLFFFIPIALLPLFVSTILYSNKFLSFGLILISVFFVMSIATIISILITTYIQNSTPENIVGKVISMLLMVSTFSIPFGQFFYGYAFDIFVNSESIIIVFAIIVSIIIALYIKINIAKVQIE